MFMEWIKKMADIIMPLEPPREEEESKEIKKADAEEAKQAPTQQPAPSPQPVQAEKPRPTPNYNQNFGGTMNFTRNGGMVSTADNGVTSMDGVRYEAFNSGSDSASVKPSLAVVKTPQLTLKIYAPTEFDEVKKIADDLLKRNAVIVNFERVNDLEQQRIGDFIIGAVYMIDGRAEMVSNRIVLYVPKEIEYETAAATLSSARRRYN